MKKINEYVEYQLNLFRKECNFTEDELELFNLMAKKMSIVQICMEMNISRTKYYCLNRTIKGKMDEVDKIYRV